MKRNGSEMRYPYRCSPTKRDEDGQQNRCVAAQTVLKAKQLFGCLRAAPIPTN